jgi:hypothetical protein
LHALRDRKVKSIAAMIPNRGYLVQNEGGKRQARTSL